MLTHLRFCFTPSGASRPLISTEATQVLVQTNVLSSSGLPLGAKLQLYSGSGLGVLLNLAQFYQITWLMRSLHWLYAWRHPSHPTLHHASLWESSMFWLDPHFRPGTQVGGWWNKRFLAVCTRPISSLSTNSTLIPQRTQTSFGNPK